jgi:hypothetical protein
MRLVAVACLCARHAQTLVLPSIRRLGGQGLYMATLYRIVNILFNVIPFFTSFGTFVVLWYRNRNLQHCNQEGMSTRGALVVLLNTFFRERDVLVEAGDNGGIFLSKW